MTTRMFAFSLVAALGMVGVPRTAVPETTANEADTVLFLQVNGVVDCYVVHVTKFRGHPARRRHAQAVAGQNLVYGDIVGYPAIFSGSQGKGRITVGWTIDGGATAMLTVFNEGFQEEVWQYVPGGGFALHSTGTWSYTGSCLNADSQLAPQVQ